MNRAEVVTASLIALSTMACGFFEHEMSPTEIEHVVEAVPEQVRIKKAEPIIWQWDDSVVRVTPLAEYHLIARVMSAEGYWLDDEARYSPLDVLVCWGLPAHPRYDGEIRWTQHSRFGNYRYRQMPQGLNPGMLRTQCANTHLVPVDSFVESEVEDIARGDVIEIRGKLINLREEWPDGRWFEWRSSTTREDAGGGACELLMVEEISINPW